MNDINENLIEGVGNEVLITILLLIIFIGFSIKILKRINWFSRYFTSILSQSSIENNNVLNIDNVTEGLLETQNEMYKIKNTNKVIKSVEKLSIIQEKIEKTNGICDDGMIEIKLKYLNENSCVIYANPESTVLDFKRKNFQDELNNNKMVRLIYNGREMKELNGKATLGSYGLVQNSTIHCLIIERKNSLNLSVSSENQNLIIQSEINIGRLMFPLFGFILSIIWYYRLNYKNHFNIFSTFILVFITGIYFVSCFVYYALSAQSNRYNVLENLENSNI